MLSEYRRYRLYEMLPGIVIWLTLIVSIVLSLVKPLWMVYAVIVFDVYWVLRVLYFSFYVVVSWWRFKRAMRVKWFEKWQTAFPNWPEKIQVIFLPLYNEEWGVVEATLLALKASSYPSSRVYVVISGEERVRAHAEWVQTLAQERFGPDFADIIPYIHPSGLVGEIPGKGSNIHYAEEQFRAYADTRGWDYANIIISVFDIDTIVHPEYLAHLGFMYCSHPRPTHSSFQPVTLYNNNLWESPAVLRIMALGTSFWMLFSLARLDSLVTFSSHSMSFQAAVDCGGHAKNIVSEDSRIFFQCWLYNGGDYEVTPLYVPVSMDTVRDTSWWKSLKNLYFQQRRWAWGTENIPFLLWEFKKHPEIPWVKKAVIFWHEFEGKWSWAVVTILITVLGQLPLWIASADLQQSTLFFNTPLVLQRLMMLSMVGLIMSATLSFLIMPPRPKQTKRHLYGYMLLQWLLLPVSLILFSALPCLDAITHLLFGRYLGFNVSTKKRASG